MKNQTGARCGRGIAALAPNPVVAVLLQVLVALLRQQRDAARTEGHYGELRTFHIAVVDAVAAGDELAVLRLCSGFRGSLDAWRH